MENSFRAVLIGESKRGAWAPSFLLPMQFLRCLQEMSLPGQYLNPDKLVSCRKPVPHFLPDFLHQKLH